MSCDHKSQSTNSVITKQNRAQHINLSFHNSKLIFRPKPKTKVQLHYL